MEAPWSCVSGGAPMSRYGGGLAAYVRQWGTPHSHVVERATELQRGRQLG